VIRMPYLLRAHSLNAMVQEQEVHVSLWHGGLVGGRFLRCMFWRQRWYRREEFKTQDIALKNL
jgi:hypothetical protein